MNRRLVVVPALPGPTITLDQLELFERIAELPLLVRRIEVVRRHRDGDPRGLRGVEQFADIAELLSHGLSNKDIAAATSLSIRTVEGHIYQESARQA